MRARPDPVARVTELRSASGDVIGELSLEPAIFGIEPNVAVLHQVVRAQLAAARAGSASTRGRSEVRGGGAKPWRQKGTGRSRQGSIRSPQWAGGGIAHGPKPRDFSQRTPKKMVRLALRSALSDRAAAGRVLVVDSWGLEEPSTKQAKAALEALDISAGKPLIVLGRDEVDETAFRSFRNLPQVHVLEADQLNAYDVLCSDTVVFTKASLALVQGGGAAPEDVPE